MDRAKVQQVIEYSGAETTEMFMDAFSKQTLGRVVDTLVFMFGDEGDVCGTAKDILKAVEYIELYGDPNS